MDDSGTDQYDYGARAEALRSERASVAKALRERGHSIRSVAKVMGVSTATVQSDLAGTEQAETGEEWMRGRFGSTPSAEQSHDPVTAPSKRIDGPAGTDMGEWMRNARDHQHGDD